ncbi:TlyA family RNA methyltransferase [Cucumibacter marinus]|uniref:TlyA family RNA methyltransferase n=1 Tax=Cucumibacter marinus TaxID=1121252 RepID=UPI0003FB0A78|nr:TlyA family RNA methyltransferase [Cucumibacter marinus]
MPDRQRLDVALEKRGLARSRARAADAIRRGTVMVNGRAALKPGQNVTEADEITIADPASRYVSRAALKLIAGLDAAGIGVEGRICLDLGASTGGFTQVLIERGAARVFAVDVGHDQLDPEVAENPSVIELEGTDARNLTRSEIPDPPDLLVCDASFISLEKLLPAALALCAARAEAVLLIKPQFEVGRENVGKGGIVRDRTAIDAAVSRVIGFMAEKGWRHLITAPSPIDGGDGNTEFIAAFACGKA